MFHILVVDDDKNIRRLIQALLEAENYTVTTAENGIEALNVFEKEHIDLAVVDIMMPKMDGYEFTKLLRDQNNNLPILMVSAKQEADDRHKGFKMGTDDYITKPIDEEEMLLRIKALLRRAKIASEHQITFDDIVIDYDSMTVKKDDEIQQLPQKEFLLLYKLLSYPGKIFTRIQLMEEIWGIDSETGWETLTVHINRLRKRFEGWDAFKIEAVRGLGYKAVKKNGQN
ncbi:MAG: response regulator transcription factor [Treponema sp.]|nr:response regulator transcription factor [Treponema sp.]MCI7566418.1 response regulator transcription factor [Treponema sp.]